MALRIAGRHIRGSVTLRANSAIALITVKTQHIAHESDKIFLSFSLVSAVFWEHWNGLAPSLISGLASYLLAIMRIIGRS